MAFQLCSSSFHSLDFNLLRRSPVASPSYQRHYSLRPRPQEFPEKELLLLSCRSRSDDEEYLLDAPVSAGDGFSFSGGKYSDEPNPADEWLKKGKTVKAHPVGGTGEKAKDPIFGLTMGSGSQASSDLLRWFCVESGNAENHPIVLIHGFPSQAYSYRKVLDILATKYHAIAFDWIGFGFSDKPQPKYGFDYTLDGTCILNIRILQTCLYTVINQLEKCGLMISTQKGKMTVLCGQMVAEYVASLESLINEITNSKATLVVQGYFAPVVVKYASSHPEKIANLILLNPPITAKHANLPSTLSIFSNFLLGEIFSQDPLRASDKALTSCGPYKIKEDVAMVYRRPYLTSGSAGFALNAISRAMKKELKAYVENMRTILKDQNWKIKTTICWGERDRWLSYDGVEDFCKESEHKLINIPAAGHHVQEDSGEELAQLITKVVGSRSYI